jgi:hypothetical protein
MTRDNPHQREQPALQIDSRFSRRRFLQGAAATGGPLALGSFGVERVFSQSMALPPPETSGIEHVVDVLQNRTAKHVGAFLPAISS